MAAIEKKPIWEPHHVSETNPAKFINYVNKKHGLQLRTYEDLHRWSVAAESLQDFWQDAYEWLQIAPRGAKPTGSMLESRVSPSFP